MRTFTVQIEDAVAEKLAGLAAVRGVNVEYLIEAGASTIADELAEGDAFLNRIVWTPEDIAAIEEGIAQCERGETIPQEQVLQNLELNMAGDPVFENLGLSLDEVGKFTQEGSFLGSDGRHVRCYDDVKLMRPLAVLMSSGDRWATAVSCATATVLSYTLGPKSVAQLECYVGEHEFAFGFEDLSHLKLHMTTEEKYAR